MAKSHWTEIKDIILSQGAADAKKLDPHEVKTAEWVRLKCQFGCGGYGSCLTCPPNSPTPAQTRRLLTETADAVAGFCEVYPGTERRNADRGPELRVLADQRWHQIQATRRDMAALLTELGGL